MNTELMQRRSGAILVIVALALVALVGVLAMAIDLGMLALAKAHCQSAADAAAVAGARALDGTSGSNIEQATAAAMEVATTNSVLTTLVSASEVSVRHGAYHYDDAGEVFVPQFPPVAPDNYNLTEVTVTRQIAGMFSRVLGSTLTTVSATATAAHRPRDVAIVLDYSGSMNNESDLWNNEGYLGSVNNTSNNTDTVFPQFGPYAPTFSPNAKLQCTSSDPRVGKCNVTISVLGVAPLVNDFYQNAAGGSGVPAFAIAGGTISNTQPGGDRYRWKNGSSSIPAVNWNELVTGSGSITVPLYTGNNGNPFGYTQGPGYWGKTFFIWPPEPTASLDWRKKFFFLSNGTTPLNDNREMWDSSGALRDPPSNYVINYRAILAWIKSAPAVFPTMLRAGHVLYYNSIPDDVPSSAYNHSNANSAISNVNQRFWKEYIDYVIGVWRAPTGSIQKPGNPSCSYGPDFTCGTSATVSITGPDASRPKAGGGTISYIAKTDNPLRPRHRFWFGPMTMIQFLSDTGLLPGTAHDISMVASKLGIAGTLLDIENNHPNDLVSMMMFSRPHFNGEAAAIGQFSMPRVPLGRNYAAIAEALWFPNGATGADVRPWDAIDAQTPRSHGDYNGNTTTDYGLMLAYNQFSGNTSLRSSGMGGWGRKGAQKIVILETDGMANVGTTASVTNAGPYKSYYNVGSLGTVTPNGSISAAQAAINVATRICALDTAAGGLPGYAQPQKPVLLHCIAFGAIFEPTATGTEQANAVSFFQTLSTLGGTVFPSSASDPANGYKWCIGTLGERQEKLRRAFTRIFDETVSVVLVK